MAKTIQKQKPAPQEKKAETTIAAKDLQDAELKDAMDAMLDEIDSVLEENAEEFVKNYIQKGGE